MGGTPRIVPREELVDPVVVRTEQADFGSGGDYDTSSAVKRLVVSAPVAMRLHTLDVVVDTKTGSDNLVVNTHKLSASQALSATATANKIADQQAISAAGRTAIDLKTGSTSGANRFEIGDKLVLVFTESDTDMETTDVQIVAGFSKIVG